MTTFELDPDSLIDASLCDGRYRIVDVLEESDYGTTFVAETSSTGVEVVVRFPANHLLSRPGFGALLVERVAKLRTFGHSRVARVMETGEHDDRRFVVAEFASEGTLDDRRERLPTGHPAPMDARQVAHWIVNVADTLDHLHAEGFVYRDLRPANLLFDSEANVRLADFSLPETTHAYEAEHGCPRENEGVPTGSADGMSPEWIVDGDVTALSDQYALGILVYDCLAGRPPFQSGSRAATLSSHEEDMPPSLDGLGVRLPPPVAAALARALEKDPNDRFPCCLDFAEAFAGGLRTDVGSILDMAPDAVPESDAVPEEEVESEREVTPESVEAPTTPEELAEDATPTREDAEDTADSNRIVTTDGPPGDPEPTRDGDPEADGSVGESTESSAEEKRSRDAPPVSAASPASSTETSPASEGLDAPFWQRPLVRVAGVVVLPIVVALLYFGYELFLAPGPDFGPPAEIARIKPRPRSDVPDDDPGRTPDATSDDPDPESNRDAGMATLAVVADDVLTARLDETLVNETLDTTDPVEALERILGAQGNEPALFIDRAALSLVDRCGFRWNRTVENEPLSKVLIAVAERLPDVCVVVHERGLGTVSTWTVAKRSGRDVLDLIPPPEDAPDGDLLERIVSADVAGKQIETALSIVATKADIPLGFDDGTEAGALEERLPADFFQRAVTAREFLVRLLADRGPYVIAVDPEAAGLRVTTRDDAERQGLVLLDPEWEGVRGRLARPLGAIDTSSDPPLSGLFAAIGESVGLETVVETGALDAAGVTDRVRRSIVRAVANDGPNAALAEMLAGVLDEHDVLVVVADFESNRLTLTTLSAAESTGRVPLDVVGAAQRVEIARSATAVARVRGELGMEFVRIDAGVQRRGAEEGEPGAEPDERPAHTIEITRPFLLGRTEVTQLAFAVVMDRNPSAFCNAGPRSDVVCDVDTSSLPVENVTWFDAVMFANRLSERAGLDPYYAIRNPRLDEETSAVVAADVTILGGSGYRLPTEAEWEYACRAGRGTPWSFGGNPEAAGPYAWTSANSDGRTHRVGVKRPNGWGLNDLHGNVGEWTFDWYRSDFYPGPDIEDPMGPRWGTAKCVRGGAYSEPTGSSRSAARGSLEPGERSDGIGFRLARTIVERDPDAD